MTDDFITAEWLASVGFKWHQFDRQPDKHWLLWLGAGLRETRRLSTIEDIGIELAPGVHRAGEDPDWFCWLRSDAAGRYHRFIHIRHLSTRRDVTDLVAAITGRTWEPLHHIYGQVLSPKQAERELEIRNRPDMRITLGGSDFQKWADIERDDTRGCALPEHMQGAIDGGKAK